VLSPGTLVDRYELVSPIGEGGMAHVWVARQKGKHGFEKLFAFKCIHPRFADDPAFRSMFLDEARIASSIEHPHVAQIFDLGESDDVLYLVMEYVDGESLGAIMTAAARRAKEAVPVPTGVALRIVADACAGLHAAHSLKDADGNPRGVVHRDVSPQNILVSVRGDVKVIDFGIAVAKDRIGGDTAAGSLKGKLHYMAPEQALRERLGPYTDVFSVGATLYRMLAGRPPFDAGNDAATLHRLLSGGPPDPLPDAVPPLVGAIIERALDRDPGNRYPSALAMQTAIEAAMMDEGYVADVATWAKANLSDGAKERRAQLAARTPNIAPSPESVSKRAAAASAPSVPSAPSAADAPSAANASFLAELGPLPDRPRATAPAPEEPRAVAPPPAPAAGPAPARPVAPAPRGPAPAPIGLDAAEGGPDEKPTNGPGMLDVRALVAKRSSPNLPRHESNGNAAKPAGAAPRKGLELDDSALPVQAAPQHVGPSTKAIPLSAGARGGNWMKLAVVLVVVVLGLAGVLLLLPMIVRDRLLASAREAGIDLTVERVGIGLGGVTVRGITAKAQRVPGAEVRADEIFATGFSAKEIRIRGLDVKLDGLMSTVGPALLGLYDDNRARLAGTGGDARKVSIVSAHVAWTGLLGEGTSLDAGEVGTDFESKAVGAEEIRASVGHFNVRTPHTTLGPWAGSFDRNPNASRLRILLDPPVPDGPSALLVWGKGSATHLTIHVARSPFARLGIRPDDLGLPADGGTEVELKIDGGQSPSTRFEGTGRLDLFAARLKGLKSPVDLKIEGAASGLPNKPLELTQTTATLGPFLANVTGSITPTDFGFRVDADWRTTPISCEKLVRSQAKSLGPIAVALQDLARSSGAARVTGTAQASGLVKYDTKSPDTATATMITREACGLSIFGL
jgi:serine/threonine-protein kinase